jgi:alkanesulfonate monooxygenase SsuD/methylene tetrahydromethanopterin reductase-like flavin-dependent oxidoreductase (luciferase family)
MLLTACLGIVKAEEASEREGAIYGVTDRSRAKRLEERIEVIRRLWLEEEVSFDGVGLQLAGVTIATRPIQKPPPIYIASQPLPGRPTAERQLRRVARLADGWMTARKNPASIADNAEQLRIYLAEEGRTIDDFPIVAYHNVNLNPDRRAAWDETERFINEYYGPIFTREEIEGWTAAGDAEQVVGDLNELFDEGATQVALRITSWDWRNQLDQLTDDVIPAVRQGEAAPNSR